MTSVRTIVLSALLLLALPAATYGQWAFVGGEHQQLRDKIILDVGTLTEESRMVDRYDPILEMNSLETVEWWEFRGSDVYCMDSGYTYLGYNTAALLLMDETQQLYVATIETQVSSIDVSVMPFIPKRCPTF